MWAGGVAVPTLQNAAEILQAHFLPRANYAHGSRFRAGCAATRREALCLNSPLRSPRPWRPIRAERRPPRSRSTCASASTRPTRFTGLPRGTAKPLRFLAAFQEAEPYLGLPAHAYKLVAWLVKQTQPQDWEEGSRPIAWPSARRAGGVSRAVAGAREAAQSGAFEAGIFVIRDNEQGKRYGRRDPRPGGSSRPSASTSRPLALRYDEFVRIAAAARVERDRMKKLRRRATLARRGIPQAGEELAAQGHEPEGWRPARGGDGRAGDRLPAGAAARTSSRLAVKAWSGGKPRPKQWLRDLIKPVETDPEGPENEPHQYTTTTLTIILIRIL